MKRVAVITIIGLVAIAFCLMTVASYAKSSYFGVDNQSVAYPKEFDDTEAAIAKAEQSPGAKVCPEKIANAKALAKKGVQTYWACRTEEAMKMLADARKMAKEAESCAPKAVIILKGVNFAFDSAELTAKSKDILDEWVGKLKAEPSNKVELAGHCDEKGSVAYNQSLSERRAQSVVDYFVSKGIAANRLKAVGYGKSKPIASNATEEGRAQNRRVELQIF